jgi:VIT1/CCC1 family predicted Fe2+/Mn2+ transporter
MSTPPAHRTPQEQEELDRQLGELLQEVRVAMPGVQILFAFLLAVPFNQRFAQTTPFQRDVYLVTLLSSAIAAACFIAPTAYHRILFHHGDRPRIIRYGTRWVLAALAALAIAMSGAVLLVVDFLFSRTTAFVVTALVLALLAWMWFGLALTRRHGLVGRPPAG